jgi:alanine dehydrogenase
MKLFRAPRLILLTGLLSLFMFSGDIVVDAVADMQGHSCEQTSQTSKQSPCTVCDCVVHCGAVLFTAAEHLSVLKLSPIGFSLFDTHQPVSALPVAIDHPPQLS